MSQPKTFWQSYGEGLSPEERIEARKRGLPVIEPSLPPAGPRVLVKKGAEPPPVPTTTPRSPASSSTPPAPSPIEALKAQVAASIAKGATPYEAWCRVRYEHPQLVAVARQVPIMKAIEAPTERQQAHQLLKSVTADLVKDGVVPDQLAAIRYLCEHAPGVVGVLRQGRVPR